MVLVGTAIAARALSFICIIRFASLYSNTTIGVSASPYKYSHVDHEPFGSSGSSPKHLAGSVAGAGSGSDTVASEMISINLLAIIHDGDRPL
jgi:hypothetical protein